MDISHCYCLRRLAPNNVLHSSSYSTSFVHFTLYKFSFLNLSPSDSFGIYYGVPFVSKLEFRRNWLNLIDIYDDAIFKGADVNQTIDIYQNNRYLLNIDHRINSNHRYLLKPSMFYSNLRYLLKRSIFTQAIDIYRIHQCLLLNHR